MTYFVFMASIQNHHGTCSKVFRSTNQWPDIDYHNVVWRIHFRIRIDFVIIFQLLMQSIYYSRTTIDYSRCSLLANVDQKSFWQILRDGCRREFRVDCHRLNYLLIALAALHFYGKLRPFVRSIYAAQEPLFIIGGWPPRWNFWFWSISWGATGLWRREYLSLSIIMNITSLSFIW